VLVGDLEAELATLLGDLAGLAHLLQADDEQLVVGSGVGATHCFPDGLAGGSDGLVEGQDGVLDDLGVGLG